MNKGFIFDWSGTLSDNFKSFYQVCTQIFRELGSKPISQEEIKQNFTLPYMKFWNRYFPDLSKDKQSILYEKYIHVADEPILYPNAKEIIKVLFDLDWKLFVVSSDPVSKLIPEIQKSQLDKYFEKVVGDVHEKDKVILSLTEEFKLDKDFTYYVGDTSGDIEAGKFAKIKTIGISWGFQTKTKLSESNPDYLIDQITDIKDMVEDFC